MIYFIAADSHNDTEWICTYHKQNYGTRPSKLHKKLKQSCPLSNHNQTIISDNAGMSKLASGHHTVMVAARGALVMMVLNKGVN